MGLESGRHPVHVRLPTGCIAVDDGGEGALPVIFIHGNGGRKELWRHQLSHLRKTRRALALDLRGFGDSDPPFDLDYSLRALASDVHLVAGDLGLEQFVLAGHSLGGAVAADLARSHPEQIAGILFVDSVGDWSAMAEEEWRQLFDQLAPGQYESCVSRWFGSLLIDSTAETRREVLTSLKATPRDSFLGALTGLVGFSPASSLEGFDKPLLVVSAQRFDDGVRSLHRVLPSCPYRGVEGVSHWMMLDKPQLLNKILDDFLSRIVA